MKKSAFEEAFKTPLRFDSGTYAVDAKGLFQEDQIVDRFMEEFDSWSSIVGEKRANLMYLIRRTNNFNWVRFYGGTNDDGEFENMWWLHSDYNREVKGSKPVITFKWDIHFIDYGHHFQVQFNEKGWYGQSDECKICKELSR